MSTHESFYTNNIPSSSTPASPTTSGAPPPPPPKPASHIRTQSADPSRSGTPLGTSTPPLGSGPPVPPHPASTTGLSGSPAPNQQPQSQNQTLPPFPTPQDFPRIPPPQSDTHWLPSTSSLSDKQITDLTPILSNPELLTALAATHPSVPASSAILRAAVVANTALASHVAGVEAQVRALRDATGQLLLQHTSLQSQWRRKQSEMDDALSPWGPRAMYQRLVSSIGEQEALLKAMQESFLDGAGGEDSMYGDGSGKASEKEVTEWLKRIREGTTTLEKRREMRARWDEGRVGGWR